jgi:hypothetical protein
MINHCLLCKAPIQKIPGHESKPDDEACWTHVNSGYMCLGSYSEYDTATFDPKERILVSADAPDDYNI